MDWSLLEHMSRFVGETVTIFTTSGGASGCGFTGVLLAINPCFVRLVNRVGSAPANPLSEVICGDDLEMDGGSCGTPHKKKNHEHKVFMVGSVCDIPVDKIAAFCHNSV